MHIREGKKLTLKGYEKVKNIHNPNGWNRMFFEKYGGRTFECLGKSSVTGKYIFVKPNGGRWFADEWKVKVLFKEFDIYEHLELNNNLFQL